MPFIAEVEEWLKELQLTPEERKVFDPIFEKAERQEKVKGSVLRQAEFSRKMQALDKQRQDAEAALAEKERVLAEDFASLGTWKQTADKALADHQKAAEDARMQVFKQQEKMKALATQYGIDPKELELGTTTPPPEPPKPPAAPAPSDLDKLYLTRKDAEALVSEVKANPYIAAELEDIVDEHRTLFGKGINRRELVTNALKNKRTLREEWEESQKVPDRRKELQERQIEERINAKVAEERTKILSEHKLPVTRGADSGSPILGMRDQLKLEGTDRTKLESTSAVDAAVAAYNTGKYKGVPPPVTAGTKT